MEAMKNKIDSLIARQITLQNKKLEKCSEKLIAANKKINLHHKEKMSRESELATANIHLIFENKEKEQRAAELAIANKKLIFENREKEKRAVELAVANSNLKKAEILQKEHIATLEEMMFIISHKVRNPVANILGISYLLADNENHSSEEFTKMVQNIIESATSLNTFTHELSTCIHTKRYQCLKPLAKSA
jgi:signal transduction histidine kinase